MQPIYSIPDQALYNNLKLKGILLTHDHYDHSGGVNEILSLYNVPVYSNCSLSTIKLFDNIDFNVNEDLKFRVLFTPGHTYSSICFLINLNDRKHLFCGDTLFTAGCGRVFTNEYQLMYNSLLKIISMNSDLLIYPGHEYTIDNLKFAKHVDVYNEEIDKRILIEKEKFLRYNITLPSTLSQELLTNPFLRHNDPQLIEFLQLYYNKSIKAGFDCFLNLRLYRNGVHRLNNVFKYVIMYALT